MPQIYLPAEDSYLLSKVLGKEIPKLVKKNEHLQFLEIGSGSGILLETAKKYGLVAGSGSKWFIVLILIVVLIVGYIVYKKRKKSYGDFCVYTWFFIWFQW